VVFNSLVFLAFFAVVFALYAGLSHRAQNRMLLVASYVFYGSWDWRFLSLILASTVLDYVCGLRIEGASEPRSRRFWMGASIAANLGILGFFKYWGFFTENFRALLASLGVEASLPVLDVILPVGISFYTFQTMSYTLDVYRREMPAQRGFPDFALYVSFFPQLVAGPIERARRLLPQVVAPRRITRERVLEGLWLALWGYFLKCFLADNLAPIADGVFSGDPPENAGMVLVGLYAFAFQIFGDFAGYSAIAIGIARMMGFELMTNFRQPYLVTNPREFWQHWHISLSTFLRDYLYVPLGGNRGSRLGTARNLSVTMLLGGLWHGAAWNFVAWGAFHGGLLAIHRTWTGFRGERPSPGAVVRALQIVAMFHVTCLGWLLFRATSLGQASDLLRTLLIGPWDLSREAVRGFSDVAFFAMPVVVVQVLERARGTIPAFLRLPEPARVAAAVLLVEALLLWGAFGGKEFIYFQF
jgi:D-alanyl-lipoteichoic acid acyltransferase DltB (MBOAT superfamily)